MAEAMPYSGESLQYDYPSFPFPIPIKIWHIDTYPALSPTGRASGRTVVIAGASGGIGRTTATSFVKGGAAHIAFLGRKKEALRETQRQVTATNASTISSIWVCDSTDAKILNEIADSVGSWDVQILCAGLMPGPSPIEAAPLNDWWSAFETNVKDAFITTQARQ
ncbi:Short chain dehydrogenase [Fulvia fulva]|uniref:Short chain dehydrogenase n=1 Tax=Passalora fulva TaxID=5499 RepID=A0A9Q8PF66_PASFU|nr:Short chain dehydrogenase [Fulvia fulva]KAK4617507.1 Short chain dehydrogenase [Fulvia fulva]KAK4618918.1 Short chain dehydrogenase [Fulvia fulva]UJO21345.1 Short chain dehydrogenase [Fulvia fulva]WPV18568.1 Short chain dehydrogenase [Fulvia fulva]WPV33015.1 Short chain dehydrogenase [Fulvia fulva]